MLGGVPKMGVCEVQGLVGFLGVRHGGEGLLGVPELGVQGEGAAGYPMSWGAG